jgi:class 3 adenylate cyclase
MLLKLSSLVIKWQEENQPHISAIGIGLDFGPVTFLEFGGRSKRQFDIIGNAINGASRLQTLTKTYDFPVVVCSEFVEQLRAADVFDESDSCFTYIGACPVKGQGERTLYGYNLS